MGSLILQLFLFQFPGDAVRSQEMIESALKARIAAAEHQEQEAIRRHRREFEKRFDTLAAAVAEFAREYNKGNGEVWPSQQADALRKAMDAVQQSDARLKAHGASGDRN